MRKVLTVIMKGVFLLRSCLKIHKLPLYLCFFFFLCHSCQQQVFQSLCHSNSSEVSLLLSSLHSFSSVLSYPLKPKLWPWHACQRSAPPTPIPPPPQWSFTDILCHSPDAALLPSLLGFSLLLPCSTDCFFWTMSILVCIAPPFDSGISALLVTTGGSGTMRSQSLFSLPLPSLPIHLSWYGWWWGGGSKTIEACSSELIWAARQTGRQTIETTS